MTRKEIRVCCYKINSWFERTKFFTFFIDLLFLSFVLTTLLFEYFKCLRFVDCLNINIDDSVSFVAAIVPMVTFVVTLTFDNYKSGDSFFGLKKKEFALLRGSFVYNMLHMVMIAVSIFVIFFVAYSLNLKYTIFIIDIISLFYSVWFSVQEFSVFIEIKPVLKRILRRHYKYSLFIEKKHSDSRQLYFDKAREYILFNYGAVSLYNYLKYKKISKNELITDIIDLQNRKLFNLYDEISIIKNGFSSNLIPITNVINGAFSNIRNLLDDNSAITFSDLNSNSAYLLTRSTFALYNICAALNLNDKFESELRKLIGEYIRFVETSKPSAFEFGSSYSILMTINTLISEDKYWFIDALLKGYDYLLLPDLNNSYSKILMFVYLLCLFYFDNKKNNVEHIHLNNIWADWTKRLVILIENGDEELLTSFLEQMYKIFSTTSEGYYYFGNMSSGFLSGDKQFSFDYVIDCWITLFVYGGYYQYSIDECLNVLKKHNEKIKELIINRLMYFWIVDGEFKNINSGFYNLLEKNNGIVSQNEYAVEALKKFVYESNYIRTKSILASSGNESIEKFNEDLDKKMDDISMSVDFKDKSLSVEREKEYSYRFLIYGENRLNLFKSYLDNLKRSVEYLLNNYILENAKTIECDNYIDISKKIIDLHLTHSKSKLVLYHLDDKDLIDNISKLVTVRSRVLPSESYFREGSIKINLEFMKGKSGVKQLTDDQVDRYIDNNYKEQNGMYMFSLDKDMYHNFLVDRVELSRIIKDNYLVCDVVLRFKIYLDDYFYIIRIKK